MVTCETCGIQIPASSMLLHTVRCVPAQQQRQRQLLQQQQPPPPYPPPPGPIAAVAGPPRAAPPPGRPPPTSPQGASDKLRCRVSSDVDELEVLHQIYPWVPGKEHVRPTPEVRAQKELLLSNLEAMWASPMDWVFHHVFQSPTTRGMDGKRTAARPSTGATIFAENPFPYDVPSGTKHWVLWMASPEAEWNEQRINAEVCRQVDVLGGGEFVWYPNPKMSVPDPNMYHVQVFWKPAGGWQ